MTPIPGVSKITSPEQIPQGPHFCILVYSTQEVMVESSGWEHELTRSTIPVIEQWVTTNPEVLPQIANELHGQKFAILSTSTPGHITQSIKF